MAETYITLPIETDPVDALDDAYTMMQALIPGWQPSPGNLDVWILQSISSIASESRDVASDVSKSIFRWFGDALVGLPPLDASPAYGYTTWTMVDSNGYVIPAGTQVTMTDTLGNVIAFETSQEIPVFPGTTTTAVGTVQIVAVEDGTLGNDLTNPVTLLDPLAFVASITITAPTSGGQDAESDDDYLDRLAATLELLAPRPIIPNDFAVLARNVPGAWRAVAIDLYNPVHNLLTVNQASAETDASGWTALGNCTIASSGAQAADGLKSVQITSTAGGNTDAATITPPVPGAAVVVKFGDVVTGLVSIRAASTPRSCRAALLWYDGGGAVIGSAVFGAAANDSTSAWTNYSVTSTAPLNAVGVRVGAYITNPPNNEVHYTDKASIRRNASTDWIAGGSPETPVARAVTIIAVDQQGVPVSAAVKAAIDADLQMRREVNFLVFESDAVITQIDVTYSVMSLAGFDKTVLRGSIDAALTSYLDPALWGTTEEDNRAWRLITKVRYLEVAQIINEVQGVDYIQSLTTGIHGGTMGTVDIDLPGVAPLPDASTLTGTVN